MDIRLPLLVIGGLASTLNNAYPQGSPASRSKPTESGLHQHQEEDDKGAVSKIYFAKSDQLYSKDTLTIESYTMKGISSVKLLVGDNSVPLVSIIHSGGAKTYSPSQIPLPFAELWELNDKSVKNSVAEANARLIEQKEAELLLQIQATGKLPLIKFSYQNGNLTKSEADTLGFYRVFGETTLKFKFYCSDSTLASTDQFEFRFKVSGKKHSTSKSAIRLLSKGKELANHKGAQKGQWVSINIPTSSIQLETSSFEVTLQGGDDKLHLECQNGIPLVEIKTGRPSAHEKRKAITDAKANEEQTELLIKNSKWMLMKVFQIKPNGIYVLKYQWRNQHGTMIPEYKPAFIVNHPNMPQLAEGDLIEGHFSEDGTIDIGYHQHPKIVKKLVWIKSE